MSWEQFGGDKPPLPLLPLTEILTEQVSTRETSAKYVLPLSIWLLSSLSGIRVMTISNIQMRGHGKCFKETQSYHYLHIPDFCSAANTLMQARKEECDVGKEAVYNLSLLCRHALRRELCWKPKYRNIYISSSYFWFGLRDFPNSRGSQWRTGQPWRACSKAERTCKLLWYPNRLLLFQGCYSNPKKQRCPFSALLTKAAGSYLGFIRGFLSDKLQLIIQFDAIS